MIHPKWTTTDPYKRLAKLTRMRNLAILSLAPLFVLAISAQELAYIEINGYIAALFEFLMLFAVGLASCLIGLALTIAHEIRQGRIYVATHESQGYTAKPQ